MGAYVAWTWARSESRLLRQVFALQVSLDTDTESVIRTILVHHVYSDGNGTRRRLGRQGIRTDLLDAWLTMSGEQNGKYDIGLLAWEILGCQVSHSSRIISSFNCQIQCLKFPWCLTAQSPVFSLLSPLQEDHRLQQLYWSLLLHCRNQDGSVVTNIGCSAQTN